MKSVGRIESIQYLRGIAALVVVLAHVASMQHSLAPDLPVFLPEFNGFWGVDIFFVISGFVIVYITHKMAAGGRVAALFMLKRAVRIVPAYWCFTLFIYFADTRHWFSDQANLTNMAMLLKSLFFVKPGFPLLFVGWTLTLEMFFYAIFSLVLWRWNAGARVWLVVGFFVLLAAMPLWIGVENRYAKFYTQAVLLEFAAGMLIAYFGVTKRMVLSKKFAVVVFISGFGLLMAVSFFQEDSILISQRAFWWGMPAAMIVLGAVHFGAVCSSKVLDGAGAISYSLYLCHMPCAYVGVVLVKYFFAGSPDLLMWYVAITLLLTLVVAVVSWWLLERWPQIVLRRALGSVT